MQKVQLGFRRLMEAFESLYELAVSVHRCNIRAATYKSVIIT